MRVSFWAGLWKWLWSSIIIKRTRNGTPIYRLGASDDETRRKKQKRKTEQANNCGRYEKCLAFSWFSLSFCFSLSLSLPFSLLATTHWQYDQLIRVFYISFSLFSIYFVEGYPHTHTYIYICFSSSFLPRRLPFFLNIDAKARRSEFVDKLCVAQGYLPVVYIERVLRRSTHTRVVAYVRTISDYALVDFLLFLQHSTRAARIFSLFLSFFLFLVVDTSLLLLIAQRCVRDRQTEGETQRIIARLISCFLSSFFCTLSKCRTCLDWEEDLPLVNDSVSASSCCWWNLHGYLRQMFDFKRHLRVQNTNIDLERKTPRRVYWNAREKRGKKRTRRKPRMIYFSEFWLNQLADHDIEHSPVDWILLRAEQNSTTDRHWSHSSKSAKQSVFVFAHRERERQSVFTWLIVRWRIPNNDGSTVSERNRISSIDWQRSGSRMNLHGRK